ncbi:MAG TPA: replicative DNA helicase [Candidatus Binataceae bacterium]|nr:replicative DNA helicase [Candidatus Binataceae bacterium]
MAESSDDILKRVPPQNLDAEQSVLGAILLDNDAIDRIVDIVKAADFYRPSHGQIFTAMIELRDRVEPVDAITLTEALSRKGALEAIGGPAYIAELASVVPTAANIEHYARIVREKALLRSLVSVSTSIASGSYESPTNVDEYLDQAEHRIFEIVDQRIRQSFHSVHDAMIKSIDQVERLYHTRELITGVPTGFIDLDRLTAGLQPTELIIIAARPGVGKTALALNIAANAAMEGDRPVGVAFFSLEMSKEQLALRLLCAQARVDSARARTGVISQDELQRLIAAADPISQTKIFIDDSSDTSVLTLKAKCRRLARDKDVNLGLIVVDYLQLMKPVKANDRRDVEIAEMSRSLKALAKELRVPVIALSQLNRQVESRTDRRPMLADLRESGAIEQDADVIAFIYRDEMYKGKESKDAGIAEIIVAKQRNGPTDTVKLTYIGSYTRFENYTPEANVFEDAGG